MKGHIFLIGFMGTGKSAVSQALSGLTGIPVLDTDECIRLREGMEITEIFSQKGEAYFRDLETALLKELQEETPKIVSCGGGMPLRPENAALMRQAGTVIWLKAKPETVYERLKADTSRPLLASRRDPDFIRGMMREREASYAAAADHALRTDGRSPAELAARIAADHERGSCCGGWSGYTSAGLNENDCELDC